MSTISYLVLYDISTLFTFDLIDQKILLHPSSSSFWSLLLKWFKQSRRFLEVEGSGVEGFWCGGQFPDAAG